MARMSRSRAAAAAVRDPTPPPPPQPTEQSEDEEMDDAPQNGSNDEEEVEGEAEGDPEDLEDEPEEDAGTPAAGSDEEGVPRGLPTPKRGYPRRRRPGRFARGSSRRRETMERDGLEDASDSGMPRRRGGWRGRAFGGGRWAKLKGGATHTLAPPVDRDGNPAVIKDDEVELPEDADGETKVNRDGVLQGDRQYRVRTFKIEGRGERLYMLSTEPARCIGFRDSYLFFQKHKQLYKIIVDEDAKKDLIDRGIIPHSYKGRPIGVVTARSVFREFGGKIVVGGRKITDDYYVAEARERGDVEGEMAVPEEDANDGAESHDRNRFVAWHGASNVYHQGALNGMPMMNGRPMESKKRKILVTGGNWMAEHALEASRFNAAIGAQRRSNRDGVYDVHTNFYHYPRIMQPTHARWEHYKDKDNDNDDDDRQDAETSNVLTDPATAMNDADTHTTIFPPVPDAYLSKFFISDTVYESAPYSTASYPGPDEALIDVGSASLSHVSAEILAELPADCAAAFLRARAEESAWQDRWKGEGADGGRAKLKITYNV